MFILHMHMINPLNLLLANAQVGAPFRLDAYFLTYFQILDTHSNLGTRHLLVT